jgi:hypothetical protein
VMSGLYLGNPMPVTNTPDLPVICNIAFTFIKFEGAVYHYLRLGPFSPFFKLNVVASLALATSRDSHGSTSCVQGD